MTTDSERARRSSARARAIRLAHMIAALAVRDSWPRGRHVTELELVGALRISRTPVRTALRLLEAHGALEGRPNRGFYLLQEGSSLARLRLDAPATVEEELHARILHDRIGGALPERVTASLLASRYAAGRGVLDRVLARLMEEGHLARDIGREWRFAPSLEGPDGVRASYEFRLLIEPAALLLPGFRVQYEAVAEQKRAHLDLVSRLSGSNARSRRRGDHLSPAAIFALDASFHQTLASFSGNPFVETAMRQQNELRRLLEFESYRHLERVLGWCREHLSILDALAATDITEVHRKLIAHLTRAAGLARKQHAGERSPGSSARIAAPGQRLPRRSSKPAR